MGLILLALATTAERDAALRGLVSDPAEPEPSLGGRAVQTVLLGVGPAAAAARLGAALGAARAAGRDVVGALNLGLGGSFDLSAAPLRSLVAVTAEVWPEYGLRRDGGPGQGEIADARALGFPQAEIDGRAVWDRLECPPEAAARAMGLSLPGAWPRGAGLTVAGVTGTAERARALTRRHAVLVESMEGFACALACALAGTPFLEIRAVSNLVGPRDPSHRDFKGALAALNLAARTLFSPAADT